MDAFIRGDILFFYLLHVLTRHGLLSVHQWNGINVILKPWSYVISCDGAVHLEVFKGNQREVEEII